MLRPVIGIELHVQLRTARKLFSNALVEFNAPPNSRVALFDAAHPGSLPVLNRDCVDQAVKAALALSATVQPWCAFDRKHYFYGDLPAGYQITQHRRPIALGGHVELNAADGFETPLRVSLVQIQLEQDTAKSLHDAHPEHALMDYNRAGTALVEIVSGPDMRSAEEAGRFIKKLQKVLRATGVSTANMEEGSLRCDVNVSIHHTGRPLGVRTEVKNLNSVRAVMQSIDFEVKRQTALHSSGSRGVRETRGFDAATGETFSLRSKEDARDYRFMPEPDVPPIRLDDAYIAALEEQIGELPDASFARLVGVLELPADQVGILQDQPGGIDYFDKVVDASRASAQACLPWVTSELLGLLHHRGLSLDASPVKPGQLGSLIASVRSGAISGRAGKAVLEIMVDGDTRLAAPIIAERGLQQVSDAAAIGALVDTLVAANQDKVGQVKAGRDRVFAWFVGQIMAQTKGKASPELVNRLLRERMGL